jgi:pimeloyl-ACP methyl ester carboxylesterase
VTHNLTDAIRDIVYGNKQGELALAHANQIACPILLITGEQDMFVSPALLAESAARLSCAKMMVVGGAGHNLQQSHPDWLASTILEWLEQH